jgi:hypothetical protein
MTSEQKLPFIPTRNVDYLIEEADEIFASNEDLHLALIGGTAVQGFYSSRRVRHTSDIDIATVDERIAERLRDRGYEIYKNRDLKKLSGRNYSKRVHIDIYPECIGSYHIDQLLFEMSRKVDDYSIRLASPEDIIAMKMGAIVDNGIGLGKHQADISCILINPSIELDLQYLAGRLKTQVCVNMKEQACLEKLVKSYLNIPRSVFEQFSAKERKFLDQEIEVLVNSLTDTNCVKCKKE